MQAEHLTQPISAFADKDFAALAQDLTVEAALTQIRERGLGQRIIYFYVMDAAQRLVGVLPTRRLLTSPLGETLNRIMVPRVAAIPATATVLEACEMFLLHKFLAFPVVDDDRRLVGVVDVSLFTDEMLDLTEKVRMDEAFQTLGFRVAEVQQASPVRAFRLRLPWLTATLASGLCCAWLASQYEATLAASLLLAFFLTLVLGLGESVSAQSVTVTVQALHGRRPDRVWFARALLKEFFTALMLGAACGLITGFAAWGWRGDGAGAFVIGGSIGASIVVACLVGLTVPTLLHRFRLDPKIAAGPVSLALADIFTLLVYFNLATFVL